MPYNPYDYMKDYSYLDKAGQALGQAIIHSAEFGIALKKNADRKDANTQFSGTMAQLGSALQKEGVDPGNVPPQRRGESNTDYQKRVVTEYIAPAVVKAESKGLDVREILKFAMGGGAAATEDKGIAKTLESGRQRTIQSEVGKAIAGSPGTQGTPAVTGTPADIDPFEADPTKMVLSPEVQGTPEIPGTPGTPAAQTKQEARQRALGVDLTGLGTPTEAAAAADLYGLPEQLTLKEEADLGIKADENKVKDKLANVKALWQKAESARKDRAVAANETKNTIESVKLFDRAVEEGRLSVSELAQANIDLNDKDNAITKSLTPGELKEARVRSKEELKLAEKTLESDVKQQIRFREKLSTEQGVKNNYTQPPLSSEDLGLAPPTAKQAIQAVVLEKTKGKSAKDYLSGIGIVDPRKIDAILKTVNDYFDALPPEQRSKTISSIAQGASIPQDLIAQLSSQATSAPTEAGGQSPDTAGASLGGTKVGGTFFEQLKAISPGKAGQLEKLAAENNLTPERIEFLARNVLSKIS